MLAIICGLPVAVSLEAYLAEKGMEKFRRSSTDRAFMKGVMFSSNLEMVFISAHAPSS